MSHDLDTETDLTEEQRKIINEWKEYAVHLLVYCEEFRVLTNDAGNDKPKKKQ